jgi:adenylyltransferase/sulfurtransferase
MGMASIRIPTPLRAFTDREATVHVRGANVREGLADLIKQYPTLKPHLYRDTDELRPLINLFLGEDNIRDLRGLDTPLADDSNLIMVPSIAGG